jgi:nucleotide-binding universal stress UspA family protein
MSYSSILTHVCEGADAQNRLRTALDLAAAFDCELIGVGAETPELYLSSRGLAWPRPGYRVQDAEQDIVARLKRLAGEFEATQGVAQTAHRWIAGLAEPSRFLAENARGADLIVASRPPPGALPCAFPMPADLVLAAGRPVLLAPPGIFTPRFGTVVVGWKDTPESRRALLDALPFLQRASHVAIVAVHEAPDRERTAAAVMDVVRRLSLLGVAATGEVVAPGPETAAEALLALADRQGCDLLVAGAYGHSRLRELVLGGFTETLLSGTRAVLFSH